MTLNCNKGKIIGRESTSSIQINLLTALEDIAVNHNYVQFRFMAEEIHDF